MQPKSPLRTAFSLIAQKWAVFSERFDRGPIDDVSKLTRFVQTRASFVAQSSLYGYLKTRMGTSFRQYFEDDVFSKSIRASAIKVFVSCLGDLAIFAAATTKQRSSLDDADATELALTCFDASIARYLSAKDLVHVPADAFAQFRRRAGQTDWAKAAESENAFIGSAEDLIRYSPVIDEYKDLDRESVRNSIRFRWRDARAELRKRIDASSVADDWLGGSRATASPAS
jgi:hypothetical protein